jgi:hypothetical protein
VFKESSTLNLYVSLHLIGSCCILLTQCVSPWSSVGRERARKIRYYYRGSLASTFTGQDDDNLAFRRNYLHCLWFAFQAQLSEILTSDWDSSQSTDGPWKSEPESDRGKMTGPGLLFGPKARLIYSGPKAETPFGPCLYPLWARSPGKSIRRASTIYFLVGLDLLEFWTGWTTEPTYLSKPTITLFPRLWILTRGYAFFFFSWNIYTHTGLEAMDGIDRCESFNPCIEKKLALYRRLLFAFLLLRSWNNIPHLLLDQVETTH